MPTSDAIQRSTHGIASYAVVQTDHSLYLNETPEVRGYAVFLPSKLPTDERR